MKIEISLSEDEIQQAFKEFYLKKMGLENSNFKIIECSPIMGRVTLEDAEIEEDDNDENKSEVPNSSD